MRNSARSSERLLVAWTTRILNISTGSKGDASNPPMSSRGHSGDALTRLRRAVIISHEKPTVMLELIRKSPGEPELRTLSGAARQ
jgi:hypothetical protein